MQCSMLSMRSYHTFGAVCAFEDGAVQIDIKKDFWIPATDATSCLRERDHSKAREQAMSPSGSSPAKGGRSRLSSAPSSDFVWVEKPGFLAGGHEALPLRIQRSIGSVAFVFSQDSVVSEEEAKRVVQADPDKYMGEPHS
eukprot:3213683-Amphidinium_carterae.2